MEQERRPRHLDQVWVECFLIAVRCHEAMAMRERTLRRIKALSQPCGDEYLRHRRDEIIKEMNKQSP
jgi:hypothetical protein